MVAKIITGSSLYGLLSYNEEKIKENKAKLIADRGIIKDLSDVDFSMSNTLWSFNDHLINNRRTKKPYVHISINPDPKDNISDEDLKELAIEYIEKLGYGEHPYVIFEHTDIDRKHLHIVTTNVGWEGKKVKDSFQRWKSMEIDGNMPGAGKEI